MPKLSPLAKKLRTKKLVKALKSVDGNMSELARREGVSPQAISDRVNGRSYVKETMAQLLDKVGVTDPYIAKKIKAGCEAKKVIYVESGDGEEGQVRETVDDHNVRHRFLNTALELKNHLSNAPIVEDHKHFHFDESLKKESVGERIKDFTNRLSQATRG